MDSRKLVFKETGIIALGELVCSGLMVGIFAALGYFSMPVLWGALFGSLAMTANYFFMAVTVTLAADRAAKGQVDSAKKSVQLSSTVRLICLGAALVLAIKLGTNPIATILPLAFARPILMLAEFFRKKGD
jgi:hypothetical protein